MRPSFLLACVVLACGCSAAPEQQGAEHRDVCGADACAPPDADTPDAGGRSDAVSNVPNDSGSVSDAADLSIPDQAVDDFATDSRVDAMTDAEAGWPDAVAVDPGVGLPAFGCSDLIEVTSGNAARVVTRAETFGLAVRVPSDHRVTWSGAAGLLRQDPIDGRLATLTVGDDVAGNVFAAGFAVVGPIHKCTGRFVVYRSAPHALAIVLEWSNDRDPDPLDAEGTDLDIHLRHPMGRWNRVPWSIYWKNTTNDWGEPGPDDDPSLTLDDVDGAGPEFIFFPNPAPGVYDVGVHYYADNGFGPSTARIEIYWGDVLIFAGQQSLRYREWFWHAASVSVPELTATSGGLVQQFFPEL